MPLIDEYQLDNYDIDGIDYRLNQFYNPHIYLNLTVPSMPSIALLTGVASDTPKSTSIPTLTVPSIPSIGVSTLVT